MASDQVVDEQPLLVEPGDALAVIGRDLIGGNSPGGDADRFAEWNRLGEFGERCVLIESAVGDDDDVGGDGVEECEDPARARR